VSIRVFLSSTFSDLRAERLEVIEVFRRLRFTAGLDIDLVTMEDFGFSPATPLDRSLALLRESDAYLGLLGHRYGSVPPGGRMSYTEREYRLAHKLAKPVFLLEKSGPINSVDIESDPAKLKRLNELRAHARAQHLVFRFDGVLELGKVLAQHLPDELLRRFPTVRGSEHPELVVPYFQLRERRRDFTQDRDRPATLDVLALSAIGLLRDRGTLRRYLSAGCHIRVLVVQRGGAAAALLSRRYPGIDNHLHEAANRAHRISADVARENSAGALQLAEIDWVPPATIFCFDAGTSSAIGWIGTYTPDLTTPANEKWVVELAAARGGSALAFYSDQFERLWNESRPVEL